MGLCNAQPYRRSREVELLGNRDKIFQSSIFHRRVISNCFLIQQEESLGLLIATEPKVRAVRPFAKDRTHEVTPPPALT
jgi:hypothetical protein